MAIQSITVRRNQLYSFYGNTAARGRCQIHLQPVGGNPDRPVLVTLRENPNFPEFAHPNFPEFAQVYAQTRELLDGTPPVRTKYIRLDLWFNGPLPGEPQALFIINVYQEGASRFRLRGPFGLLDDRSESSENEITAQVLGSLGISAADLNPESCDT